MSNVHNGGPTKDLVYECTNGHVFDLTIPVTLVVRVGPCPECMAPRKVISENK